MPAEAATARPTLLVFADDWGRHPSSCQHLIGQLLDDYHVHWINTIGTRSPKFNLATLARGFEKAKQWFRPPSQIDSAIPTRLNVVNPRMWPSFKSSFARRLNRRLLTRQLTPLVEAMPQPVYAITTLPITADLVGLLPIERWTYYCVDDFGEWPGLDREVLHEMETVLVNRVDDVIAVSNTLQNRIAAMGRTSTLLTHGVDLGHWQSDDCEVPQNLRSNLDAYRRPLIVFWGVIDRRLNVQFLSQLCHDLQDGTVLLVGPENDPPPELATLPRLARLGSIPYQSLPDLARRAAVLIMPYADLPVTRAMQPLKLKEYLATGKPVVVSDLPACGQWRDSLDIAHSAVEFSQLVRQRIDSGISIAQQTARMALADESWQSKAIEFERIILGRSVVPAPIASVGTPA